MSNKFSAARLKRLMIGAGVLIFLVTNKWRYGGWLWAGRYGFESEMRPIPLWERARPPHGRCGSQ